MSDEHIINRLYETLQDRKNADPKKSYAAQLFARGTKQITKKLGEEAVELVIAGVRLDEKPHKEKRLEDFKDETADLIFHLLVLLAHHDVEPEEVFTILEKRLGIGGLVEKKSRKGQKS